MTSQGLKHLHKHCLQSKTSTNSHLLTIGPRPPAFSRSTGDTRLRWRQGSRCVKINRNYNHWRYLVYTGYSIQMRVHFLTQSCSSLLSIAQMVRKNVRFNAFDLKSSDRAWGLFRAFCLVIKAGCHGVYKETFVEWWSGTRSDCSCITNHKYTIS